MAQMRLVVAGAGGRMGRTLVKAIAENKDLTLAGALEDARSPLIGHDSGVLAGLPGNGIKLTSDAAALLDKADGIIDFTAPAATLAFAALVAKAGKVHIIGTTGLSAADEAKIKDAAKSAVIVKSGNMSLGVNLLAALTRRVAKTLDNSFDIEILEMHHNQKVDAPSGTALMFGRAAAEGRGIDLDKKFGAQPRRQHRRAPCRRHRLCEFARRHRGRRAHGDFRRSRRAHRTCAQGRGPHDLRARRAARGLVGARPEAGALFDGRRARLGEFLKGAAMTPEQVTKRLGWAYAIDRRRHRAADRGLPIRDPSPRHAEPPPDYAPYLFGSLGVACFIAGGILWAKLKKDPTPAATTDLSAPGGKTVKILLVIGFAAMAGTWLVRYVTPENEVLGASLSGILLVVAAACLIGAGRIGRKMRASASATGASKE